MPAVGCRPLRGRCLCTSLDDEPGLRALLSARCVPRSSPGRACVAGCVREGQARAPRHRSPRLPLLRGCGSLGLAILVTDCRRDLPQRPSGHPLAGALLPEENDEWLVQRGYRSLESIALILAAARL